MITPSRLLQCIFHKISNLHEQSKKGALHGTLVLHIMNLRISAKCRLKKLRVDNALHFIREMSPTLTKAVGHSVSGPGVRAFLTDLTRGAVSCSNIIIRQCSGTGDFAVYLEQQPTIACKCPLNACLESFRWYIVGGCRRRCRVHRSKRLGVCVWGLDSLCCRLRGASCF